MGDERKEKSRSLSCKGPVTDGGEAEAKVRVEKAVWVGAKGSVG